MHVAVKILVVVVVGVLLGLGATWFVTSRGGMGDSVVDGPWKTSLVVGSPQSDPYTRARVALHGLLALNRNETIYYTATTDNEGHALDGHCVYEIRGRDPNTRWWSNWPATCPRPTTRARLNGSGGSNADETNRSRSPPRGPGFSRLCEPPSA